MKQPFTPYQLALALGIQNTRDEFPFLAATLERQLRASLNLPPNPTR